jgi:tRNA A-37 threonylcarbamoyl transferase component Bud32
MSKIQQFISYKKNNIDIKVTSEIKKEWVDDFIDKYCKDDQEKIKSGETIYFIRNQIIKIFDPILDKYIVIKKFNFKKNYDKIRFRFLNSKAERSLKMARALIENGLKTPKPIAVIEKRGKTNEIIFSYYITEHIKNEFNMLEIGDDFEHPNRDKFRYLLPYLAKDIKYMHDSNIIHNDLHAGNILIKNVNSDPSFYYVDLNRGRVKNKLSIKDRVNDLKRFRFTEQEKKIFFKNYSLENWRYYKDKVTKARKKREKFVNIKKKLRSFLGIKKD